MGLLHRFLMTETKRLMKRDIRVVALGETERLPARVREALDATVEATRDNRAMTLGLALSYGGRQDIVNSARRLAKMAAANEIDPDSITERELGLSLATGEMPDPDLWIRTSGEIRISNCYLFQLAYTELYFTETLWPDFRERDFLSALSAYQSRDRRFGTVDSRPHGLRASTG